KADVEYCWNVSYTPDNYSPYAAATFFGDQDPTNECFTPKQPASYACSPGYWKNDGAKFSAGDWTAPYDPNDTFEATFGIAVGPDFISKTWNGSSSPTLLDALNAQGPGSNFYRLAVDALLNAAYFNPSAVPGIITAVQQHDISKLGFTENCPLNHSAKVSGNVFNDVNNSGIKDTGETGLSGVQVFVVDYLTLHQIALTTDEDGGFYGFGVPPGLALVQAAPIPAGHIPSNGFSTFSFPTVSQNGATTVNFALKPVTPAEKGTILIEVFNDANSNGIRDAGETGVSGATVFTFELLTAKADVQTTGVTGITTHSGLIPDVVLAQINAAVLPSGFSTVTTANGGFEYIVVTPGSTTTVKIGLH
ncbi:MAG: hypothetical protein JHC41_02250, partial [Nitrosopumilus sp.]|nr:hypothetical protein [Nitrosopumilus sp.]